jgi:hypothetical protein
MLRHLCVNITFLHWYAMVSFPFPYSPKSSDSGIPALDKSFYASHSFRLHLFHTDLLAFDSDIIQKLLQLPILIIPSCYWVWV